MCFDKTKTLDSVNIFLYNWIIFRVLFFTNSNNYNRLKSWTISEVSKWTNELELQMWICKLADLPWERDGVLSCTFTSDSGGCSARLHGRRRLSTHCLLVCRLHSDSDSLWLPLVVYINSAWRKHRAYLPEESLLISANECPDPPLQAPGRRR